MTDQERDAQKVTHPSDTPPDEGLAYDPEMTEPDEANIPPESKADPEVADTSDDRLVPEGDR
jgi:hypothetical protein